MKQFRFNGWIILSCGMLSLFIVFAGVGLAQESAGSLALSEDEREQLKRLRKGQLDMLRSDSVVINDMSYLLTDYTEFYDSEDDLEIGKTVWFLPSADNTYIEALYPLESSDDEEESTTSAMDDEDEEEVEAVGTDESSYSSPGDMPTLQDEVWVN